MRCYGIFWDDTGYSWENRGNSEFFKQQSLAIPDGGGCDLGIPLFGMM